ncbi:MAG: TolC family outer membrane protein [Sphingomonadales bacterium]|nr:TolC family outer membrane protein [Sphingomonadales bacterium]
MAYNSNPTLQAARAQQRAVDEGVPIARSASLPSVSGSAAYTEFLHNSASSPLAPDRNFDLSVSAGVPIYAGGAIKNSIRAARTRVTAGQADLRATESGVFSQVVAAYMDVILSQAVVGLNASNVKQLDVNLQATRDRFEIGDLTRTDVAQSQSRLALARGQTRSAEANLIAARERYIQVVGKAPEALQAPPPLPGLPASADEAVQIALDDNPDLIAARERSKAAAFDTQVAGSGRLPTVSVFTGADRSDYLGSNNLAGAVQATTTAQAGIRATIPLFQGGLPAAQHRQAQAREGAVLEQEIGIEREVIAATRSAFASWQAAQALITSSQTAVDAAALSLEGVRAENTVGNRTILDILNAEQESLNAQVQLVTAQRNAYVAGFNLLSAMGKAEARDLGLDGGALYDPNVNYNRVKNTVWDWARDPAPKPHATRTVDTKAQDGSVPAQ